MRLLDNLVCLFLSSERQHGKEVLEEAEAASPAADLLDICPDAHGGEAPRLTSSFGAPGLESRSMLAACLLIIVGDSSVQGI